MKFKNRFLLLSLVFTSLILGACKKIVNAPDNEGKNLFGTWEFFDSSGGLTGVGKADSDKHTLRFGKDGKVTKFEKGIVVGKATFSFLDKSYPLPNGKQYFYIAIKNQRGRMKMEQKQSFIIYTDTLYLAPSEVSDSYTFHYKRK